MILPRRVVPAAVSSVFTLGNLLSGFFAIIEAAEGNLVGAGWLVVLAGFFDVLDGMVARAIRATSRFGVQLDSLSDMISFGVAPSVLLYQAAFSDVRFGAFVAAIPVLGSAVRLAGFNLLSIPHQGMKPDFYLGLPTPAAAGVIVSFLLTDESSGWFVSLVGGRVSAFLPITLFVSLLMVSRIRFPALLPPTRGNLRRHLWRYLGYLVVPALLFVFREVGLLVSVGAYLLIGLGGALAWLLRALRSDNDSTPDS